MKNDKYKIAIWTGIRLAGSSILIGMLFSENQKIVNEFYLLVD